MRSSRIMQALNPITRVLTRDRRGNTEKRTRPCEDRSRDESCFQKPSSTWSHQRARSSKEGFFPRPFGGRVACWHLGLLVSPTTTKYILVVLSHLVCGTRLGIPRKQIEGETPDVAENRLDGKILHLSGISRLWLPLATKSWCVFQTQVCFLPLNVASGIQHRAPVPWPLNGPLIQSTKLWFPSAWSLQTGQRKMSAPSVPGHQGSLSGGRRRD